MDYYIWNVNPILIDFGILQLRWYGLLFVGAFLIGVQIGHWIYKKEGRDPALLDTLLIYIMVGTIVGARLMHCLAYEPAYYLENPIEIFMIQKGGLASHGGLLGVVLAVYLFARRHNESYLWLLSRTAIPGALAATFIRLGNLFNSEILGKPTDMPWGIIFSRVDMTPRHPVQLYEALAYFFLLIVLLIVYKKSKPEFVTKIFPAIFFTYVFTVRFFLEYTKTIQAHYATELPFNTGQVLSIPFILLGIIWTIWALKSEKTTLS